MAIIYSHPPSMYIRLSCRPCRPCCRRCRRRPCHRLWCYLRFRTLKSPPFVTGANIYSTQTSVNMYYSFAASRKRLSFVLIFAIQTKKPALWCWFLCTTYYISISRKRFTRSATGGCVWKSPPSFWVNDCLPPSYGSLMKRCAVA